MAADKFAKFLTHLTSKATSSSTRATTARTCTSSSRASVAIKKKVKDGETALAVLEKGDFFGEMAMLERLPRSATAEVRGGGRPASCISGDIFGDMIKANPEIAVRMLRK